MRGQLQILNYRVKMKRKTKFTKQSKKKNQNEKNEVHI
jgi:hypothetical protein